MSKFGGGGNKCAVCKKTVYNTEAAPGIDVPIHTTCFKCQFAGCKVKLTLTNYGSLENIYYCKNHFEEISYRKKHSTEEEKSRKKTWQEDIQKLKDFKKRGILTDKEYDEKEKMILEKGL
eukprot:gene10771-3390_t